jgi:Fic family protein
VGGWGFGDDEADERTLLEAENGREQARTVQTWVRVALRHEGRVRFPVTVDRVRWLNRVAMRGLIPTAGELRTRSDLEIAWSKHVLPPHEQVPALLVEACDLVNDQPDWVPIYRAAYILWRICWIHPFEDGNGRTARAISYFVLCHRTGFELPGKHPIPERIKQAPIAYTRALEAADQAWTEGRLDVSELARLLLLYMVAQLRNDPLGLPPGA